MLHRSNTSVPEPYHWHRFAKNFGYDQAISPNQEFPLARRLYKGRDTHLVAAAWCDFSCRGEPEKLPISGLDCRGRFDVHYALWWFAHIHLYCQKSSTIKKALEGRLLREDQPPILLDEEFLRTHFSRIRREVERIAHQWPWDSGVSSSLRWGYNGAIRPLRSAQVGPVATTQVGTSRSRPSRTWWT